MEVKEKIEKSIPNFGAKEVFIQVISNLKKSGIEIPKNLVERINEEEWDSKGEPSERIKDIQRKIKSIIKKIIKKEIGLKEKEINRILDKFNAKEDGFTEIWKIFQLYIHLKDEKMLDKMIKNLYS